MQSRGSSKCGQSHPTSRSCKYLSTAAQCNNDCCTIAIVKEKIAVQHTVNQDKVYVCSTTVSQN